MWEIQLPWFSSWLLVSVSFPLPTFSISHRPSDGQQRFYVFIVFSKYGKCCSRYRLQVIRFSLVSYITESIFSFLCASVDESFATSATSKHGDQHFMAVALLTAYL